MFRPFHRIAVFLTLSWFAVSFERQAPAQSFSVDLIAKGLSKPTGINVDVYGNLYYTEVPTPGISGTKGGTNRVSRLDSSHKKTTLVSSGDPYPVNLATDLYGNVYWTCQSANVIVRRTQFGTGSQSVLLSGLKAPIGVDVPLFFPNLIFFTQVPTPGVSGADGGKNEVSAGVKLFKSFFPITLHSGEPEPVDIAVSIDGTLYWTCRTAGVILMRSTVGEISVVESGLQRPTGLDIDLYGRLYWTEIPTPGVAGSNGGKNRVVRYSPSSKKMDVVHLGDPEPYDISVTPFGDEIYWTCRTAGVILRARAAAIQDNPQ